MSRACPRSVSRTMMRIDTRPGEQQRPEVSDLGQAQPAEAPSAAGEQLSFVDQVRGEEQDEQDLRGLAGLEVHRADPHPEPRPVDRLPDPGCERQQQGEHPEEQERVPVPLEGPDPLDEHQGEDERDDAHRGPDRLDPPQPGVEAGHGDEAEPVQQRGERQQHRVGVGGEASDREVGEDEEAEHRGEDHPQVGWDVGGLGQLHQQVPERGDDHREDPEPELGGPPVRQRGGRHGAAGRRSGGPSTSAWWSGGPWSWWWTSSSAGRPGVGAPGRTPGRR